MACPLCGDQCHCSAAPAEDAHVSVLIDPENFDDSEQQFAASVDTDAGSFTHDVLEDAPLGTLSGLGSGTPVVTPQLEHVETVLIEAATSEPPAFYRPPEPPVWRDEVSNRVEAYRTKRGRARRYDPMSSLSLDFDSLPEIDTAPAPARYAPVKVEAPEAKILEFPKPMPVASVTELPPLLPPSEELAEPMLETPRILDVPEGMHALPEQPLADIKLDEPEADPALDAIAASVELPLPVAPMGPRIAAGMIDLLIVLTMTAVFGIIFMMIAKELPQGRDLAACALAVPGLLWAVYHFVFLDRCATTPGMQMTQLGLATFPEDKPVTRNQRRARALAMSVSAMSLWLGFAWTFLDEDRLAWHDRISHTFLANQ
ncbi:MAG TPA: RDD family protein [Terriglobales bacterium]|nr:RDD family protein [Terriglobales bacterium]